MKNTKAKWLSALLALGMAAGLTGAEPKSSFTGTARGFGGEVSVELEVEGGKITACKASGEMETKGIGSRAIEELPARIVEAGTYEVEGVSGATITSGAVKDAAKAAMEAAGLLEKAAAGAMKPGSYTASYHGYTSDVVVETTVSGDAIVSVKVVDEGETVGIGSYAIERMPGEMVEKQTAMVDMVTGATATSMAIRQGVLDCLKQAGADMAVFAKEPEAPVPTDVTYETDIVVIGAGAAGLSAAVEALDSGASVIVVEKMDIPGGNTVRSSGAFNVAGHPEQVEHNAKRADVEYFIDYTMTGGHNINNPELVRYMVENSAGIVDWMREIGFEAKFGEGYGSCNVPGVARGLITGFRDKVEARGGKVLMHTKANEILMENGKAVGIKATGADGGTVTVRAKAVIVATGGFGYNLKMCYELKPEFDGFVTNNHVGATGDGIVMATAVGAATVDMEQIQAHPTVHQATANMLTEGCRTAGGILINTSGKRFIDECTYRDVVANAILAQDEKHAFLLLNQGIVDSNVNIQGYIKLGTLTGPYDSIDAAADAMGVSREALAETVANWNSYVAQKNDPEFGSHFEWFRDLSVGPWYVSQIAPGIHHTMGGLKINTSTEVLNEAGEAIPGLFACGEVTGGVHGGNRVGGNAILDCLVFGYTAGGQSAAYVK